VSLKNPYISVPSEDVNEFLRLHFERV